MSRALWFAVGAGTSVYAMVKTRRAAERFTVSGLSDQIGALGAGARLLRDDVRVGMAERETELRAHLAVLDPGHPTKPAITQGPSRGAERGTH